MRFSGAKSRKLRLRLPPCPPPFYFFIFFWGGRIGPLTPLTIEKFCFDPLPRECTLTLGGANSARVISNNFPFIAKGQLLWFGRLLVSGRPGFYFFLLFPPLLQFRLDLLEYCS